MDSILKSGLKKLADSYEHRASHLRIEAGEARSQRHRSKLLGKAESLDEVVRDLMAIAAKID